MYDNQNPETKTFLIADLVKAAQSTQEGPDLYCNHVVATIFENELVMDFYQVEPSREDTGQPKAIHRQRIVLPERIIPGFLKMISSMDEIYKAKSSK
ncbi:MAG TPA: hypothetical protein PLS77_13890 [Anaerolineaceae bacterium]|nr:hypothetical protein [Anaerolineaceae bacterium]HOU45448.1 hypothetical protein [Anaerolineaceae bacterium]HQF46909.1 hypothetical protein [Anaerolineaceae bacterium]HQH36787.1 hypothetical protein [Anaerolineaceae bacterium]